MFRKMRRFKQQLPDAEAEAILQNGTTGVLAVLGDGGYPYTVPLSYVYREGKIYFHGAKSGHKLDAMKACDKVSFCVIEKDEIVAEKLTTYFRSVVVFGRAKILERPEDIVAAAQALGMKFSGNREKVDTEITKELPALCCVEISVEHMTGKEAIELTRVRG